MSLPLIYHPDVLPELDIEYGKYELQREGLGLDFLAAVESVFSRIADFPEIYGTVYRDVRCGLARRFPYGIYYRACPDHVEILAVHHTSRDASSWRLRS
jgi:hypothetical protein